MESQQTGRRGTSEFGPLRTCSNTCEQSKKEPTIQLRKRAQGSSRREDRQRRNVQVNMAPATGHVLAISPSTAARHNMNKPEMGQAMAYMEPLPVLKAVRTARMLPARERKRGRVDERDARREASGGNVGEWASDTVSKRSESECAERRRSSHLGSRRYCTASNPTPPKSRSPCSTPPRSPTRRDASSQYWVHRSGISNCQALSLHRLSCWWWKDVTENGFVW